MDFSGIVAEKFCHQLSFAETCSTELMLPSAFLLKYGNRLHDNMECHLRNGYVIPVEVDRSSGLLKGFYRFFKDFGLEGGELLMFEYFGRSNINVYIFGKNNSEIRYPSNVPLFADCYPRLVTVGDGGWRFVCFVNDIGSNLDEIELPSYFLIRCCSSLPQHLKFFISNGKTFSGSFCPESQKLRGLRTLCDVIGVPDFSRYHMFLFSYCLPDVMTISAFDKGLYEIVFPGTPVSVG